jgi:uncharacterized protein (DUF1810 family)
MSQHYAIKSITEAQAYLSHPVLGPRLLDCAAALLAIEGKSARQILGSPDDLKLHSCATLFSLVSPPDSLFHQLLNKFFENHPDQQTLQLTATPTQRRDLP